MKALGLLLILLSSSGAIPLSAQIQTPAASPGQAQRRPTSPGAPDTESAQHPATEQQEVPKATLRGHVYARATGAPLKRARLMLRPAARPTDTMTATTDEQGTYEFRNVEPGSYTLQCTRNGYVRTSYGQKSSRQPPVRLTVRPGQELEDLDFHLIRGGVISGRVLDEDGEPLYGVLVRAMARKYWQGEVHLRSWRQDSSDDRGEYRIFGVPPGRYYVKAVWQDPRYSDLAPVFYPNSLRAEEAPRITVVAGGEVPRVDIRMEMVPTLSVSGKVVDLVTGRPVQGSVQVRPDDVTMPEFSSGLRKSDGSFRVRGLVPGRHYLIVHVARSRNSGKRSPLLVKPFDLRDANIENMEVRVGPGVTVHGKIVAKGGEVSFDGLRVMLASKASTYALRVRGYMSQVNEDLTFEMSNVQPGQYNVNVSSLKAMFTPLGNRWFYVGEVRADGKNLVELGLIVNENAPVPALEIVLDFTGGTVTGLLRDEDGKPTSSVDVALLSTDPEKRASGRYFRRGVPDQDGKYKISTIIPGDYLLLPWPESELAPPFQDPELFAQLEERAVRVTVDKSTIVQQDITVTEDIQTIVRKFEQWDRWGNRISRRGKRSR